MLFLTFLPVSNYFPRGGWFIDSNDAKKAGRKRAWLSQYTAQKPRIYSPRRRKRPRKRHPNKYAKHLQFAATFLFRFRARCGQHRPFFPIHNFSWPVKNRAIVKYVWNVQPYHYTGQRDEPGRENPADEKKGSLQISSASQLSGMPVTLCSIMNRVSSFFPRAVVPSYEKMQ